MNALILMGVYIVGFAIFELTAVGIGFMTDAWVPAWSMIIFLGTTAAAFWAAWPVALWLTRNVPA
jgi:hypothetical protein